jgi:hypothetical protein
MQRGKVDRIVAGYDKFVRGPDTGPANGCYSNASQYRAERREDPVSHALAVFDQSLFVKEALCDLT